MKSSAPEAETFVDVGSWGEAFDQLEGIAAREGLEAAIHRLEELIRENPAATDVYLLGGKLLATHEEHRAALSLFSQAQRLALPGTLTWRHPYTRFQAQAQIRLDPRDLPCQKTAAGYFESNIKVFRETDAEAAREVERAENPKDLRIIDIWGKLMLANPGNGRIAVLTDPFTDKVNPFLMDLKPVAVYGINSGQEVLHLLENTPKVFLGQTSCHYLFEQNPSRLRIFLHLADLTSALQERRLIIFGGSRWQESLRRIFATRRYHDPCASVGDKNPYLPHCDQVIQFTKLSAIEEKSIDDYYRSEAFKNRLRAIARGEVRPRGLFLTCRWTTVLQHVCATFHNGFEELGCEAETLLEKSDVEMLNTGTYYEALGRFKPDLAFSISHARPSYHFLPKELPFIGFIMDNCGPILNLQRLEHAVQPHDLFLCINQGFKKLLLEKGIPESQLQVMITPSDPKVYRPLDPDHPLMRRHEVDISWVKHAGSGDAAQCLRDLENGMLGNPSDPFQHMAIQTLHRIHERISSNRSRQWFDQDIWEEAQALIDPKTPREWRERLQALLVQYKITVYAASFRQFLLEPLARSGLRLRLYGNGWAKHPLFAKFAAGTVPPGEDLDAVYNASRINLHIHNEMSMHQRLVDGALAGGFFLVNRLDPKRDYEPLAPYYEEGREVVLFDSGEDLLDKCRYYLSHDDERRAIAGRMRERALQSYTVDKVSGKILEILKQRLIQCFKF